jgi:hypothetical protein
MPRATARGVFRSPPVWRPRTLRIALIRGMRGTTHFVPTATVRTRPRTTKVVGWQSPISMFGWIHLSAWILLGREGKTCDQFNLARLPATAQAAHLLLVLVGYFARVVPKNPCGWHFSFAGLTAIKSERIPSRGVGAPRMQRTTCTRDFLLSGVIALAAIVFLLVLRAEDVARHTVAILLLPGLRAADVTGYGFQDAGLARKSSNARARREN